MFRFPIPLRAPEGEGGGSASAAPTPTPSPAPASPPMASPATDATGMPSVVRSPGKEIDSSKMTASEAGRMLRRLRQPAKAETPETPPAGLEAQDARPEGLTSTGADTPDGPAPDQPEGDEATGEIAEDAPQEDATSEPPRSWSAEDRAIWSELSPAAQEKILQRASEDERATRKAQNEAAQVRQSMDQQLLAERTQLEQVRQQYEAALPDLFRMLAMNEQFADIQSFDDVENLAKTDWARYIEYDAHVKKMGIVQQQMLQAQQRQAEEYNQNWARWSTQEDQKFADKVPDMRDPAKAKVVHDNGGKTLTEVGFSPHEINELWNGRASLSMRDHRVQQLFYDAIQFRASKGQVESAKARNLPPVQRPGVAQSGNRNVQALQSAKQKLAASGNIKDGVALLRAQRAANARAAR